jgi:hypothetical protein
MGHRKAIHLRRIKPSAKKIRSNIRPDQPHSKVTVKAAKRPTEKTTKNKLERGSAQNDEQSWVQLGRLGERTYFEKEEDKKEEGEKVEVGLKC